MTNQAESFINHQVDVPVNTEVGVRLMSFITRIENVQLELDAYKEDQKEIYSEAKSVGFDVKILRKVVKRRKMEADKRREEDDLVDTYELAVSNLNSMME